MWMWPALRLNEVKHTLPLRCHMCRVCVCQREKDGAPAKHVRVSGCSCDALLLSGLFLLCLRLMPSPIIIVVCLSVCLSAPPLPLCRSCCSSPKLLNVATQSHFSPGSGIGMTPLFRNRLRSTSRACCHFVSRSRNHLLNGQFVTRPREYALCPVGFSFLIAILALHLSQF